MRTIQPAQPGDLNALLALENTCFVTDRLSRRSWQRLLVRPTAAVLVSRIDNALAGALVLLFRRRSHTARLYSIAVSPQHRSKGIGEALVAAAEALAQTRGCRRIRLEVREDNAASRALFARMGYTAFGEAPLYYEDGATAIRWQKALPHTE
ncbi:MAG: GNAT family N-acetyltransferase [Proteobacteria bacterium]|nr:GNAT family N-acetyltransferase [Pseudomonadota bacterium]